MARQQGARTALAAAFETIYGTAPASGYKALAFAKLGLGAKQPLLASELVGFGRDPLPPVQDALTAEGEIVVPIETKSFGFWLKAAFGAPVTTGTGPYTHVFSSGLWSLPSLAMEVQMPQVPHFAMYAGAMVDTLAWQMARSGLLTATVGLKAQGEAIAAATAAGTPATNLAGNRLGNFHGSIARGGTLTSVVSCDISYSNNLDPVEVIRSDGKISGLDPTLASLGGSLTMRFDTQTFVTQAAAATASNLTLSYALGTESLTVLMPKVILERTGVTIEGPAGVQASFNWQAMQNTGGAAMVTLTLVNDIASY